MDLLKAMRLYLIPDRKIGAPRTLIEQTAACLAGGATAIQLRDKEMEGRELLHTAQKMAELCRAEGALFFVNDRLDIALLSGAHGLHIGQSDIPLAEARRLAPPGFLIGVSAQTEEQARAALEGGADYLGIGPAAPTTTKETEMLGCAGISRVATATPLPCVAIGGITLDNLSAVMRSGVSGISLISAVIGKADIEAETRKFAEDLGLQKNLQQA